MRDRQRKGVGRGEGRGGGKGGLWGVGGGRGGVPANDTVSSCIFSEPICISSWQKSTPICPGNEIRTTCAATARSLTCVGLSFGRDRGQCLPCSPVN